MVEETISAANLNTFLRPQFEEQKEWDVSWDGVFAQSLSTKVLHLHNIFGIEFDCLFKNFVANISDIESSLIFRIFNYGSRVIHMQVSFDTTGTRSFNQK